MLSNNALLEGDIDLIVNLLLGLILETLIRDTRIPRNEIQIVPSQLLVLKIWHVLDGYMSLLATACGCLDIPFR
jgi:hypothetical protein